MGCNQWPTWASQTLSSLCHLCNQETVVAVSAIHVNPRRPSFTTLRNKFTSYNVAQSNLSLQHDSLFGTKKLTSWLMVSFAGFVWFKNCKVFRNHSETSSFISLSQLCIHELRTRFNLQNNKITAKYHREVCTKSEVNCLQVCAQRSMAR